MSGRKIFTKRFFDLAHRDRAAIVDSVIADLKSVLGRVAPEDRKAVARQIKRVAKKAVEFGIYQEKVEVNL